MDLDHNESSIQGETTMTDVRRFTAMIYREDGGYVALCPELDVASQGDSVEEASSNLREAVELFIETADPSEIEGRIRQEMYVTALEVSSG
jgi:predicted RNase H-like HicB family nuclease